MRVPFLAAAALAGGVLAAGALAAAAQAKPGRFFDAVDANGDGVLTAAEWKAAGRRPEGFQMMDANRDGQVTRAEGRAAMERIRAGGAPAPGAAAPK